MQGSMALEKLLICKSFLGEAVDELELETMDNDKWIKMSSLGKPVQVIRKWHSVAIISIYICE